MRWLVSDKSIILKSTTVPDKSVDYNLLGSPPPFPRPVDLGKTDFTCSGIVQLDLPWGWTWGLEQRLLDVITSGQLTSIISAHIHSQTYTHTALCIGTHISPHKKHLSA